MKSLVERLRARRLASIFVLLATLSTGILIGSVVAHGVKGQEAQTDSSDATPLKIPKSTVAPNAFSQIAKQVGPAVVNINTETLPKEQQQGRRRGGNRLRQQPNPDDDQDNQDQGQDQDQDQGIPDFFKRFFGQGPDDDGGGADGEVRQSLGSGFIVDPKGYIITNNHVVEKADKIYVKLASDPDTSDQGRPAHVIGTDPDTDIAVIKIDTKETLPSVKLGNSDSSQVGDWVIAIGSPFSLSQTVTAGIVSAKNRTIEPGAKGQFQHFIQTDAAINPGNSGGPLVNMNGEVIGVNTAIFTQSMGYQGIGFAMPANTVIQVYNDLIGPTHKVVRGSIGISFRQNLPAAVSRVYGFKNGVLVQSISPGGPADKAGIKVGDVIVSIDGRQIKDGDDLVNDIASRRPGTALRLGYLRDGKEGTASLTVGDRTKVFAATAPNAPGEDNNPNGPAGAGEGKIGIMVRDLPSALTDKTNISGVLIQSVRPGSFAFEIGLPEGGVITRVNKQPVSNRQTFDAVVSKLKSGEDVVFEVVDPKAPNSGVNYIAGTLP
jgi:serine protease Do